MWPLKRSEEEKVKEGNFAQMGEFLDQLEEFIRNYMTEGIDYGYIYDEETGKRSDKPVLFKAGAEKLLRAFGLVVEYHVEKKEDWEKGFFVYEVEAKAYKDGEYLGSGFGIAVSREKRFRDRDIHELPNALIKLAKKRALVDLVLTLTAASSYFLRSSAEVDEGKLSEEQRRYMRKLARDKGLEWDFVKENIIKPLTGKDSSKKLTRAEASQVIDALLRWEGQK